MRKRRILSVAAALLLAASLFAFGCGKDGEIDYGEWGEPPVKELSYVDRLPTSPKAVDKSLYNYDDMEQHVKIEMLGSHYGAQPPTNNPITNYMAKKYNADLTFTAINGADFANVIMSMFSEETPPDVIILPAANIDIAEDLYDMDLIMDASKILRYMPNLMQYVTKEYYQHGSKDGFLFGAPKYQIQCDYNLFIRADWLKEFDMPMPKNPDELYAYAEKCKSVKGCYFMTSALYGGTFGMMERLKSNFGHPHFNVKDGTINHPVVDGTDYQFLKFLNKCISNKLIHPDWETMSWESTKSLIAQDKLGMVDYPASLYEEYWKANGREGNLYENWEPLAPFTGMKAAPAATPSYYFVFPKQMENKPTAAKRIAHMFDECIYTGDDFFNTIQGGGNDVFGKQVETIKPLENGRTEFMIDEKSHPYYNGEIADSPISILAWQNVGLTDLWLDSYYAPKPAYSDFYNARYAEIRGYERWENYFEVKLNTVDLKYMSNFMAQEYVKFAKGDRSLDEWNIFVMDWKNKYKGKQLLDSAAEQLNVKKIG